MVHQSTIRAADFKASIAIRYRLLWIGLDPDAVSIKVSDISLPSFAENKVNWAVTNTVLLLRIPSHMSIVAKRFLDAETRRLSARSPFNRKPLKQKGRNLSAPAGKPYLKALR
jgi:hypothetical protein